MKNKLASIILILIVSTTINAQVTDTVYKVSLDRLVDDPHHGYITTLRAVDDHSFLKNIPNIECDISAINYFKLNQYISKDSIPNQMYLFIGVNLNKKEKYVMVDANNNYDFSDDQLYTFSLPDKPLTRPEKAERAIALRVIPDPKKNDTVNIGIDPFNFFSYKYNSPQDERLEVIILLTEYMSAKAEIDSISVNIGGSLAPNLFQRNIDENTYFNFHYKDKGGQYINKTIDIQNNTIQINNKLYELSKMNILVSI